MALRASPGAAASVSNTQPVTAHPSILVGTANRTVWVRVEGKGTFLNSTGLKEFSKEMINRGHREFVIDLRNCPFPSTRTQTVRFTVPTRMEELAVTA